MRRIPEQHRGDAFPRRSEMSKRSATKARAADSGERVEREPVDGEVHGWPAQSVVSASPLPTLKRPYQCRGSSNSPGGESRCRRQEENTGPTRGALVEAANPRCLQQLEEEQTSISGHPAGSWLAQVEMCMRNRLAAALLASLTSSSLMSDRNPVTESPRCW